MKFRASLMVFPFLWAMLPGAVSAEYIACPLNRIVTDVTTPKPAGWWSTPQEGALQGTDILQMGDKPVLLCYYGVGSIMRDAPPGSECRAEARGFRCQGQAMESYGGISGTAVTEAGSTPSGMGAPYPGSGAASSSGLSRQVRLPQTYTLDLDSGRIKAGKKSDLWFMARTSTALFLKPINGASMAVVPRGNVDVSGCLSGRFSRSRTVRLSRVAPDSGQCLCVYTNDPGTLAAVCVDAIREEGGYPLMPEWGTRPANHYLPRRKTRITLHEDELERADNPLKKEKRKLKQRVDEPTLDDVTSW